MSLDIECLKVSPDSISGWLHLAPALLRTHLTSAVTSQADPDSSLLAWGLTIKSKNLDRPVKVALVLADCDEVTNEADELIDVLSIYSIIVAKKFRRFGFAKHLLGHVITWAKNVGLDGVRLPIPLESKYLEALRSLTPSDAGWIASAGQVVANFSDSESAYELLQRLERSAKLRSRNANWEITSFPDLPNKALQDRIPYAKERGWQVPWDPASGDHRWTPCQKHSRLALCDGEIIGWMITNLVDSNSLHYAKFWIDPGWEKSGAPFALLAEVVRSAHFSDPKDRIKNARFISFVDNYRHHHWMMQKVRPVCDRWMEIANHDLLF